VEGRGHPESMSRRWPISAQTVSGPLMQSVPAQSSQYFETPGGQVEESQFAGAQVLAYYIYIYIYIYIYTSVCIYVVHAYNNLIPSILIETNLIYPLNSTGADRASDVGAYDVKCRRKSSAVFRDPLWAGGLNGSASLEAKWQRLSRGCDLKGLLLIP
jgi:hypothetical protein